MKHSAIFAGLCAAGLAGCAAPAQFAAVPANGVALPQTRTWMAAGSTSGDLLYVTNSNATVTVYTYPQGKLVGTLKNFASAEGACADKSGNVYITDYSAGRIYEYAHGGTKAIAILKDVEYHPQGCSVDPTTGDLAVANYETSWGYPGNLSVYRKARGVARPYIVEDMYYYLYAAYDGSGNAFVDGEFGSYGEGFEFAELPHKGSTLNGMLLPATIGAPGGVEWDGKYLAIEDVSSGKVYQFAIAKGKATLENTTTLQGVGEVGQFAVDGSTLVAPNQYSSGSSVLFFDYPDGGSPTLTITEGVFYPRAVAISLASRA